MKKMVVIVLLSMQIQAFFDEFKVANAFQKGDFDKASALVQNQLMEHPSDAQMLFDAGVLAHKNGTYDKSATYFSKAVEQTLDKKLKEQALFNEATALALNNQLQESLERYKQLLQEYPDNERAQYNKRVIEEKLKQQQQQKQQQKEQDKKDQQKNKDNERKEKGQQSQDNKQEGNKGQEERNNQHNQQGGQQSDNQKKSDNNKKTSEDQHDKNQQNGNQSQNQQGDQKGQDKNQEAGEQQHGKEQRKQEDGNKEQQSGQHTKEQHQASAAKHEQDAKQGRLHQALSAQEEKEQMPDASDRKGHLLYLIDQEAKDAQKQLLKTTVRQEMPNAHGQKNW